VALVVELAARAFVEGERRVDPVAVLRGQPPGAVEDAVGLLAAGERQLDRAFRLVALLLVADQQVREDGGLGLVVARAAAVEIAAFFDQREGIALPVRTPGLDSPVNPRGRA
jgi:hypothetical protein